MAYITAFLEGIISFISPCILPILPLYFSYLAGGVAEQDQEKNLLLKNSIAFVIGFTILFVALGAASTTIGQFLQSHLDMLNRIGGVLVILFALNNLGFVLIPALNNNHKFQMKGLQNMNVPKSMLFGLVFALGWTPCVGPLLGSALMMAANAEMVTKGMLTLFFYAMGLGIPFLLSAILIEQLEGVFAAIKKHSKLITIISGLFLLAFGIALTLGFNPAALFL
ncbi:MAG: cytochrome c biogenesis protein CcdA [Sphaerochaeta sp.]|uniref:cytochrome c biogenesis CcdA family protein n=1 Tax=Sphaerochaeta sp. S2 TaxID=2798868 RepID=UPI0018EA0DC0|nr:cytochrome c biogenesis protein CcdA [Sphaerochaeta sp. S2]MBJ2356275.1 sulfite exporter TauE/SafE family protein [Sphaerochaeta sp. S2]MCK9349255.1 cytochrome c biogenesis protein CcdA [Sphaerochaeta sp.]MDD4646973.1 cytochrome c biogenesis protein CcdA [Sphaerochaeta sp.]